MEKESVKKFDLEAAFKALDEIELPKADGGIKANRVDLKERFSHKPAHETLIEDYYDVSSNEDLEEAKEEREGEIAQAKLARIEKIVDLDAESPDDLLPSYVGKTIIQCPQCMTLFYKNPEDIERSEENPDVVNINEICQHCGNSSGYNVIGKVGAVSENEESKYQAAEADEQPQEEENELDLNFEEPTEEHGAEGAEEGGDELSDEELDDLNLELEELPEESEEEEKKEESLNRSNELEDAEKNSELATEHKSDNVTLNEDTADESLNNSEAQKDAEEGSELKTENESENLTLNEAKYDAELTVHDTWKVNGIEAESEEDAEEIAQEKIDNGEEDDYSEYDDGIKVTKVAESLAEDASGSADEEPQNEGLKEGIDKDLDKKLKEHNDYIEYLKKMIEQEEEALKKTENEEVKAAIQRRLDAFNADLEDALPAALKADAIEERAEEPAEETPDVEEPAKEEQIADEQIGDTPEDDENGAQAEEQLTEDAAKEITYDEYKHSYCNALSKKLRAINYLVNVKKIDVEVLKKYILKLLKDPEVRWTDKEKEFKKNIEEKTDAHDILNYIKNSLEKAKTIEVKVDADGELVESCDGCVYEMLTESVNNSEAQKAAEEHSELKTENESEKLTLNESDDDLIKSIINSWKFEDVTEALEPADAESVKAEVDSWTEDGDKLEECGDKQLVEEDEVDEPVNEPEQEAHEDEAKNAEEPLPETEFTTEEVKEVVEEVVDETLGHMPEDAKIDADVEKESAVEIVKEKAEEKINAEAEAPAEETADAEQEQTEETQEAEQADEKLVEDVDAGLDKLLDSKEFNTPISDAEVKNYLREPNDEPAKESLAMAEDFDEASFKEHALAYLTEVYSNVSDIDITGCSLDDGKLVVEGLIKFSSGKARGTKFAFTEDADAERLTLRGTNEDIAANAKFTLIGKMADGHTLVTESIGYDYSINGVLVEGLK